MYWNRSSAICTLIAVTLAAGWSTSAYADDDFKLDLTIGDKAPALDIEHWIKGDKIKEFEKGKVYVVEFWATWCGPCVQNMPHLSELQEKYAKKGVTIIGISDEKLDMVTSFLKKEYASDKKIHDQRARYTLAADPDESSDKAYMKAARQMGIPTAFLVGKTGLIEWIGHPVELDDVLEKVVKDEWDAKSFKKTFEAQMQLESLLQKGDMEAAQKLLADLVKADPDNLQFAQMQFMIHMQMEEYDQALKVLDRVEKAEGEDAGVGMMRAHILCMKKDYEAAFKVLAKEVKANWDDSQMLNDIAWFLVADENLEKRDLKLALKAAERACELTDHSNAAILDTLARAHYEMGDLDKAIKWQTKAMESLGEDAGPMGGGIKETLDKYKREAEQKGK